MNLLLLVGALQFAVVSLLFIVDPRLVGSGSGEIGYRLTGGFMGDYGLGATLVGIASLSWVFYGDAKIRRQFGVFLYGVSWVFLLLSRTRSRILTGIVIALVFLVTNPRLEVRRKVLLGGLLAVTALVLSGAFVPLADYATRQWQGVSTLTGRTSAFTFLMDAWRESPLIGLGYASGNRLALIPLVELGQPIGLAHDALSKVLVDLGLLGATLLFGSYLLAWLELLRCYPQTKRLGSQHHLVLVQCMAILVLLGVSSVASPGIAHTSVPYAVALATTALLRRSVPNALQQPSVGGRVP